MFKDIQFHKHGRVTVTYEDGYMANVHMSEVFILQGIDGNNSVAHIS
jgi:hypothetical protein